jgi:hypothetical protein
MAPCRPIKGSKERWCGDSGMTREICLYVVETMALRVERDRNGEHGRHDRIVDPGRYDMRGGKIVPLGNVGCD